VVNPLNAELNPICHLLALLVAHHILHVSRIRVNLATRYYAATEVKTYPHAFLVSALDGNWLQALGYSHLNPKENAVSTVGNKAGWAPEADWSEWR